MEVVRYTLGLEELLERDANCVEVTIDSLTENVDPAYRLAESRGCTSQSLREKPILLYEDERGEVRDQ